MLDVDRKYQGAQTACELDVVTDNAATDDNLPHDAGLVLGVVVATFLGADAAEIGLVIVEPIKRNQRVECGQFLDAWAKHQLFIDGAEPLSVGAARRGGESDQHCPRPTRTDDVDAGGSVVLALIAEDDVELTDVKVWVLQPLHQSGN